MIKSGWLGYVVGLALWTNKEWLKRREEGRYNV